MSLFMVLLGCANEDCTPYDPGAGFYVCDQVEICVVGNGPENFYRAADGTEYNCLAEDTDCARMLCDNCDLDRIARDTICP